jgi:hypothetical protein
MPKTKSLLPAPLLALAASGDLRDAFCYLTCCRHVALEQALHLMSAGNGWIEKRIPKPRGGERVIHAPSKPLKEVSRDILLHLVQKMVVHRCAHGCLPHTSVVTNARRHAGFARAVYNVDLKDAFPSLTEDRIRQLLGFKIQTVISETMETDTPTEEALRDAIIAFSVVDGVLPQGFPTSPGLLNAALYPLDRDIGLLLRNVSGQNFRFTRYVDDITVSTDAPSIGKETRKAILRKIREHGWTVNRRKVHFHGSAEEGDEEYSSKMPTVTGLVVHPDGRVTIPRWKLERWRGFLHSVVLKPEVTDEDRAKAAGIVGFVSMVYDGALPSVIRKPFAEARERFGSKRAYGYEDEELSSDEDEGEK